MVLIQSYLHIKYLERVLLALQHTKEHINRVERTLPSNALLMQQLSDIQHQFVDFQQRKGCIGNTVASNPAMQPTEGFSSVKTYRVRRVPPKRQRLEMTESQCGETVRPSNIVHLPPTLTVHSKPQKRIKLASTEPAPGQDQVVPSSPILGPSMPPALCSSTSSLAVKPHKAESQMVPDTPQTANRMWLYPGFPAACNISHDNNVQGSGIKSEDTNVHSTGMLSPDLVCDEESTSWPDDDSSSGGSYPELPDCPWFSTPVHSTTFLQANQQTTTAIKGRLFLRRQEEKFSPSCKSNVGRKRKMFKDSKKHYKETSKGGRGKPRKKYQKRATAARVRAWAYMEGCGPNPVKPFSAIKPRCQIDKIYLHERNGQVNCPFDSPPWQKEEGLDTVLHPPAGTNPRAMDKQQLQVTETVSSSQEEQEVDVVEVTEPVLSKELSILFNDFVKTNDADDSDALPACDAPSNGFCLDLERPDSADPPCLQDVSIPPPSGTISPPHLPRSAASPTSLTYTSPELFQSSRGRWLQTSDGFQQLFEENIPTQSVDYQDGESFYGYSPGRGSCLEADSKEVITADCVDDLFEADLGDVRHLDPALQPPSSSLDSEDCSVWLSRYECKKLQAVGTASKFETVDPVPRPTKSSAAPRKDGEITKALASFATSALKLPCRKARHGEKQGNIRLNLPPVATATSSEEEDINIWKFTQAALNEKDVLRFLPSDTTYSFLSSN